MFNYYFNIKAFLLRIKNENKYKYLGRRFGRYFDITYVTIKRLIFRYLLFKNYVKS